MTPVATYTKRATMKNYITLLATFLISTTTSVHALLVPAGLVNGDRYHIIFKTSGTIDGTSSDIATYNNFVNAAAASGTETAGATYSVIASTPTVSAAANIASITSSPYPIYNTLGELVFNNGSEIFGGNLQNLARYDESGVQRNGLHWTGSNHATGGSFLPLGGPGIIHYGENSLGSASWLQRGGSNSSSTYALLGISEELTATVPEPSTAIPLFGLLAVVAWKRNRK